MEMFFPRCHSTHANLKVGLLLLVSTTLLKNGSTLQCNRCLEGWYVKRNCSTTKIGIEIATLCKACQKCDGDGQTILVNCTEWSNTLCGCEDGYTPQTSSSLCQKVVTTSTVLSTFASIGISATETPIIPPLERVWILAAVLALLGAVFIALTMTVWFGACVSYKLGGKLPNTEYNII